MLNRYNDGFMLRNKVAAQVLSILCAMCGFLTWRWQLTVDSWQLTAKFLGCGFKPQPRNNPPQGGRLNPLCFESVDLRFEILDWRIEELMDWLPIAPTTSETRFLCIFLPNKRKFFLETGFLAAPTRFEILDCRLNCSWDRFQLQPRNLGIYN